MLTSAPSSLVPVFESASASAAFLSAQGVQATSPTVSPYPWLAERTRDGDLVVYWLATDECLRRLSAAELCALWPEAARTTTPLSNAAIQQLHRALARVGPGHSPGQMLYSLRAADQDTARGLGYTAADAAAQLGVLETTARWLFWLVNHAFGFAQGVEYNAAGVRLPATMMGFAPPTLRRQLRKLQTAGVVRFQPAGRGIPAYDVQFNHEYLLGLQRAQLPQFLQLALY